jgi:RNA polymerase sigma factor (sigma-70 family)
MEASALHAPAAIGRLGLSPPLLRLRSDDQLLALFRAGSDEAFSVIHDRYRQRLFAYVRQMLSSTTRADAEDVLQDVFVRAYGALRADERDVKLKAWLYRVAHNRCIDQLRRPTPPPCDIFEVSRTPLLDPIDTAQRRDDLRRLVQDVGRLPEQQRSALLMREIDGMAYAHIATALDVTVPAVKSLLVRARVGLVEAIEARDTDCAVIRADLAGAYDRGVKASGRARRHMRECTGCREYRGALRGVRKSFAALSPVAAAGPLALLAKVFGIGGAGGGAAASGGAAVGGGGATIAGTTAAAATVCKVAAVVCTAAIATGGAVEVQRLTAPHHPAPAKAARGWAAGAPGVAAATATLPVTPEVIRHRTGAPTSGQAEKHATRHGASSAPAEPAAPAVDGAVTEPTDESIGLVTGGAVAPADEQPAVEPTTGTTTGAEAGGGTAEGQSPASAGAGQAPDEPAPADPQQPGGSGAATGGSPGSGGPPPEH